MYILHKVIFVFISRDRVYVLVLNLETSRKLHVVFISSFEIWFYCTIIFLLSFNSKN